MPNYADKEIDQIKLHAALESLQRCLIDVCSDLTTVVTVNVNCEGYSTKIHERSPESLKRDGISMRNIKGEFIR